MQAACSPMQTALSVIQIHPARNSAEIDTLIEVFCRAFDQDAHFNWIVRQDGRRSAAFRQLFKLMLTDVAGTCGAIYATADLKAAAIWFPPETSKLSLLTQVRVGLRFAAICGWKDLAVRAYGLNVMEHRHPKTPHYFLQTIGVDPLSQRQGHGAALLGPILHRCDMEDIPAYLETSNPDNVGFYEKHGFRLNATAILPQGPMLHQMLRLPQPITNKW